MLPWMIVLAILGLVLAIVEFFMPGFGIFGISGAVALLASSIMIGVEYGLYAFLFAVIGLLCLLALGIWYMKKTGFYKKMILSEIQSTKDFDESVVAMLVGHKGVTVSQLRPYGKAIIDGKEVDVFSQGSFIDRDCTVEVVDVKGKNVVVRELAS